jgi:hypothetical protein
MILWIDDYPVQVVLEDHTALLHVWGDTVELGAAQLMDWQTVLSVGSTQAEITPPPGLRPPVTGQTQYQPMFKPPRRPDDKAK